MILVLLSGRSILDLRLVWKALFRRSRTPLGRTTKRSKLSIGHFITHSTHPNQVPRWQPHFNILWGTYTAHQTKAHVASNHQSFLICLIQQVHGKGTTCTAVRPVPAFGAFIGHVQRLIERSPDGETILTGECC